MTQLSSATWFRLKALAFLRRDCLFETTYKLQTAFKVTAILFRVATFYFLAKLIGEDTGRQYLQEYGEDYFTFVLIGLAFTDFFNAGVVNVTTSIRQQLAVGVLEAMAATPIRSGSLMFYSLLWPMGFELVKAFLYLALGTWLLGAQIELARVPLFLLSLFLSLIVFGCLGVIASSLIVYFKKGDPIAWILASVTQLLSGVLFPVSTLPEWLQAVAQLIPVTHALEALRASLVVRAAPSHLLEHVLALCLFAVVLAPIAIFWSHKLFDMARRDGNLSQY